MAFKQQAYPLQLDTQPSRLLLLIHALLHIAAVAAVLIVTLHPLIVAVALCAILINGYCSYRWCRREMSMLWDGDGLWQIRIDDNPPQSALLLGSSVLTRYCVWLHFRTTDKRFVAVVLLPDSLSVEKFRRLRVRLLIDRNRQEWSEFS